MRSGWTPKTSPYEFYQYWRNVGDADVLKCIRMLTFLPLEEIDKMDAWEGAQLNTAKEILAYELTKLVHGEEEANKAQEVARGLFAKGRILRTCPSTALSAEDLTDGSIGILDLMLRCGLVPSERGSPSLGTARGRGSRRRKGKRDFRSFHRRAALWRGGWSSRKERRYSTGLIWPLDLIGKQRVPDLCFWDTLFLYLHILFWLRERLAFVL